MSKFTGIYESLVERIKEVLPDLYARTGPLSLDSPERLDEAFMVELRGYNTGPATTYIGDQYTMTFDITLWGTNINNDESEFRGIVSTLVANFKTLRETLLSDNRLDNEDVELVQFINSPGQDFSPNGEYISLTETYEISFTEERS